MITINLSFEGSWLHTELDTTQLCFCDCLHSFQETACLYSWMSFITLPFCSQSSVQGYWITNPHYIIYLWFRYLQNSTRPWSLRSIQLYSSNLEPVMTVVNRITIFFSPWTCYDCREQNKPQHGQSTLKTHQQESPKKVVSFRHGCQIIIFWHASHL